MPLSTVGASSIAEEEEVDGCAAIFSPPFLSAPETSTVLMGVCIRKEKSCFFLSLISFLVQHFFSLLREKKLFLWKK
jgi:hypothetical protein